MRPQLPLCLSIICLFLSTAAVTGTSHNTTDAPEKTGTLSPNSTSSVGINATKQPFSTNFINTSNMSEVTTIKSQQQVPIEPTTGATPTKAPMMTSEVKRETLTTSGKPIKTDQGSSGGTVVLLVFLILLLLILLVILYRWYQRNPNRRTCRGLWDSIVETAQWAWGTVMALLQRSQKQPEQVEDEEEDEEEEDEGEGQAVVVEMEVQDGDAGQKTERNAKEAQEGARKNEDDASSDSDTSSEDYSFVEGGNTADDEKEKDGDAASKKSNKEDRVEMTSVKLDDEEDVEKAEPEESDDLTPL